MGLFGGNLVAGPERSLLSGARDVLPFGFGQEAVGALGLLGQPGGVRVRVIAIDADHRAVTRRLDEARVEPPHVMTLLTVDHAGRARRMLGFPDERLELLNEYLVAADGERSLDADLLHWPLVGLAASLELGRAHHELPLLDHDHERAFGAVAEATRLGEQFLVLVGIDLDRLARTVAVGRRDLVDFGYTATAAHARAAADLFVLLFLRHGLARAKRGVVVDQEHHENRRHGGGEYR